LDAEVRVLKVVRMRQRQSETLQGKFVGREHSESRNETGGSFESSLKIILETSGGERSETNAQLGP